MQSALSSSKDVANVSMKNWSDQAQAQCGWSHGALVAGARDVGKVPPSHILKSFAVSSVSSLLAPSITLCKALIVVL